MLEPGFEASLSSTPRLHVQRKTGRKREGKQRKQRRQKRKVKTNPTVLSQAVKTARGLPGTSAWPTGSPGLGN